MRDVFPEAVAFIFHWEGGLSNDPADPGGITNFGISQRAYPDLNIKALTKDGASSIFFRDYWTRCSCAQLPPSLAILVFDCAVNQGANQAIRLLQNSLRVTADGLIGPVTLAAAAKAGNGTVVELAARRAFLYGVNPLFLRDGLSWSRRLMACVQLALSL